MTEDAKDQDREHHPLDSDEFSQSFLVRKTDVRSHPELGSVNLICHENHEPGKKPFACILSIAEVKRFLPELADAVKEHKEYEKEKTQQEEERLKQVGVQYRNQNR